MNTRQARTSDTPFGAASSWSPRPASDAALDPLLSGQTPEPDAPLSRWMGWRLRLLVGTALLGCLGLFFLARWLAEPPHIDAHWRANALGRVELMASDLPLLRSHEGRALLSVRAAGSAPIDVDALALQPSSRWLPADAERERRRSLHARLAQALAQPTVGLLMSDGESVEVQPTRRGFTNLGAMFWLLAGLALVLYLLAMVVLLAKPTLRNTLYALISLCQSGNLIFIAVESTLQLGLPQPFPGWDMPVRMAFDLVMVAAIVHAATLHPRRVPHAGAFALTGWVSAAALVALAAADRLAHLWWWTQGGVIALGALAVGLLSWSYRIEPHPYALVLRRFGIMAVSTWTLLTLAIAVAGTRPGVQQSLAAIGSTVWYVFLAALLLLVPFLSKSQQVMREFSLLAAISTVATSLDLLFVAVFSLGQFASLTLSLFLSLAVYSGARQWILSQLLGNNMLTTERMFEQLYRIAREVEANPARTPTLLSQLLRDQFDPMQIDLIERRASSSRVFGDGSTLVVPIPHLAGDDGAKDRAVLLRFAHRGRRLFTREDARLTDRIVEQLQRAVAFDKAVEQGRSDERMRLAQDLHDDIGARLLTLMYKAQSPEMEDYVRHTLQDLKTLTRGLAAPNHLLTHAAGEWKSDLTQRLAAAHVDLGWSFSHDNDIQLSVVQWSALTRVLRELVSNAIAHANARRVEVDLHLEGDRLDLTVSDNGQGRNPRAWSHGLGLGGVRKRVKQLGGEVEWREVSPLGISCRVCIRKLSERQ